MHKEEKEFGIFKVAFNLAIACLVSGVIIGTTYYFTAPIAAQKSADMKQQSMKALISDADSFKEIDGKEGWFEADKAGKVIGYVVPAESKGFSGTISMLVAVGVDGKVLKYDILSSNETPGLGDNASKEPFKSQFNGKTSDQLVVVKDPALKDNIQAMTGATITSKAVTKGIKEAVEEVTAYIGGGK